MSLKFKLKPRAKITGQFSLTKWTRMSNEKVLKSVLLQAVILLSISYHSCRTNHLYLNSTDPPAECDNEYKPVCGSDGVTYSNLCELERAKRETGKHKIADYGGPCKLNCEHVACPEGSKCVLKNEVARCTCRIAICPKIARHNVCGTDGIDYDNCEFIRYKCRDRSLEEAWSFARCDQGRPHSRLLI